MTVSDALKQTWTAIVAESPTAPGYYHRRIPIDCVWSAHAGIHRPSNARILILEAESNAARAHGLKDETKGYDIDIAEDDAGRHDRISIIIKETSEAYRDIFSIFCSDILTHWVEHAAISDALKSLGGRLDRWKRFFQRGTNQGLSREDHVGLYGELSFIEGALKAGMSGLSVVNAWQAPLSANQDFLFGTVAVEVKTTTGNDVDKVRITNARQLDTTGLSSLFLARYAFDFRRGAGRTLTELILELKTLLAATSIEAANLFVDRLFEAGFIDGTTNEFEIWGFTPRRLDFFAVTDGFPRLLESTVPTGITELAYALNLSAAASHHIGTAKFWSKLTT